ncbi:hypothetical protein QA633_40030 [Bradyrhizobium barranii]|uniref:hypothetical protein n=1 Tax=Bradyrhizobium barranii TaxID=2992140 RepID=UPI0024AF5BE6|nr:hypothetical protein [Bradyrhizobium barranii]WFT94381.1 hypothetical protein QA633_40030 [Bradyrhizobium barranii]
MIEQALAPDAVRLHFHANDNFGPTEYRTLYNEWKKTAPPNDSDIIPDKAKVSETTRHAGLCADLQALLKWKAIRDDTGDPLQTNYLQDPKDEEYDDDNQDSKGVVRDALRTLNDGPPAKRMLKSFDGIAFKKTYDLVLCGLEYAWRERLVVDLDAPENQEAVITYRDKGEERTRPRVVLGGALHSVVQLNHVKISDIDGDELKPLGSISTWGLKAEEQKAKKPRVRGSRNFKIAAAPPPCLNPETLLIEREYRSAVNDNLDARYIRTLDAAVTSPNFESVGIQLGYAAGKTAERWGKRLTLEACKAFDELNQQLAA